MTERLYYTDAALLDFEAEVLAVEPVAAGQVRVRLDRTAFYPTSGGQPHDLGRLGDGPVADVAEAPDGEIWHTVPAASAPAVGTQVSGLVDAARRFDHRQQHSGQHLLSAAFERHCGARTISFHLGSDTSTIDLERPVSGPETAAAELAANEVVWDNRPVRVRFVSSTEAATLPLRKPTRRQGRIRLVEMSDFDLSACGGTHVDRTGGVGLIVVTGTERFKQGTRVGFVCGGRALARTRMWRDELGESARLLSVPVERLAGAIERGRSEQHGLRREVRTLRERLSAADAEALLGRAVPLDGWRLVVATVSGHDARSLKALALELRRQPDLIAVLTTDAEKPLAVVATADDVTVDAGTLWRALSEHWGGRGGGRADFAQGALDSAPDHAISKVVESHLLSYKDV